MSGAVIGALASAVVGLIGAVTALIYAKASRVRADAALQDHLSNQHNK